MLSITFVLWFKNGQNTNWYVLSRREYGLDLNLCVRCDCWFIMTRNSEIYSTDHFFIKHHIILYQQSEGSSITPYPMYRVTYHAKRTKIIKTYQSELKPHHLTIKKQGLFAASAKTSAVKRPLPTEVGSFRQMGISRPGSTRKTTIPWLRELNWIYILGCC